MAGDSSDFRLSKCVKSGDVSVEVHEDRFKYLPITMLVYILAFLPIEHSARTSILAKYWRGLWMYTLRLDFDASELIAKLFAANLPKRRWGAKYVEWVNNVLSAHKALHSDKDEVIEEFRICFELDQLYQLDIDAWLSYAFSMKVLSLELNLLQHDSPPCLIPEAYSFPSLLDPTSGEYSDKTSVHRKPLELTEFRILKSLSLAGVNVTEEAIDFLFIKFPLLESLKVCNSEALVSVKIGGRPLALKHLEITHCMNLESIIVCDSHLVSLKISLVPHLVLENVPMLVNIWVSAERVREILPQLYTCLSRVKVLTLSVKAYDTEEDGAKVINVPQLPELKELILIVDEVEEGSLIPLTSLMRSTPNLGKFVLKLKHVKALIMIDVDYEEPLNLPLDHLKAVEVRGYHGLAMEDELVKYLQENAKALARIVLEPSDVDVGRNQAAPLNKRNKRKMPVVVVENIRDKAKARAEKLKGVVPSSVKLVVL